MWFKNKLCFIIITIVFTSLLQSCQQYSESFEVLRVPLIRTKVNGETWRANTYVVQNLGKIVHYDGPTDLEGSIFFRVNIIGFRNDSNIERLEFTIDVRDVNNMVGEYTTTYTENGGIHNIEWIEPQTNPGFFPFYSLCDASDATTTFTIERQSTSETLIAGTFETTLCERTDISNQITLSDGEFDDLDYDNEDNN